MTNADRMKNITFAANLLPLLPDTGNHVISPYGIAAVLAMAAEGARKESLEEILLTLGFRSLDELRTSLATAIAETSDAFRNENTITLMKGCHGMKLLDRFNRTMQNQYSAAVKENDSDGEPAVRLWNTARFKAEWLCQMECDTSRRNCFQNADGSFCCPAFLSCAEQLRCYKDDDFRASVKAVALPYKRNASQIPYELVLVECERPLNKALLEEIFANLCRTKCEVAFPAFSIKSEFDLIPMMKALELKTIFDAENGAFDRIAAEPLYAETFGQKAEIQVDEHGTIAKAITCMVCLKGGVTKSVDKYTFKRPFHYFLRNTESGEIMFMGKVNQLNDCERSRSQF